MTKDVDFRAVGVTWTARVAASAAGAVGESRGIVFYDVTTLGDLRGLLCYTCLFRGLRLNAWRELLVLWVFN